MNKENHSKNCCKNHNAHNGLGCCSEGNHSQKSDKKKKALKKIFDIHGSQMDFINKHLK